MRDGPARALVKMIALARYTFDLRVTRLIRRLRGEPAFVLRGSCQLCAACCETPMIQVHPVVYYGRLLRRAFLAWHRLVNGFELLRTERESFTFVFRCSHFDPVTRRCDSYATRPGMCRDYPRPLLWTSDPQFLDGCGYYAQLRTADRMRAALDRADLDSEQRERLQRRLHLRE